jgi:hypothetical protein
MRTDNPRDRILAMGPVQRGQVIRPADVHKRLGLSTDYASNVLRDMARDRLLLKVGPESYQRATPARFWLSDPWGRTESSPRIFGPLEWSRGA